ncbi:CapA family protein [Lentibacillus sp. N15]|uniref:CapA family protein n=1 Tax=Lentibacillus songyuanensis TaxID=3136161 RepID=UPI0031BB4C21
MNTWRLTVFILVSFFLLTGCASDRVANNKMGQIVPSSKTTVDLKEWSKQVTLSAVGDILIHDRVYRDAKGKDGYDFHPMLAKVKPFLNDATITFANQESMMGGEKIGLSSYPSFNSPIEIGDALKGAGVNIVSMANNHTLDRGEEAIQQAIKNWKTIGMMYTGAFENKQDQNDLRIYQTDEGISVAFLAYTYGTNGIEVPNGKDYLVNLIDKDTMAGAIKKAKKQADVTVLSLHFGEEYERMPNDEQKDLAQFAADHGVDVVLGHHPHVLQPIEWVKGKHGNKTLVIYSLGNFLSGQDDDYTRIGGILTFTIKQTMKEANKKETTVTKPRFMPTYVTFHNETDYRVVPMHQLTNKELKHADKHYQEIKDHMAQWMPELEFVEAEDES